MPSSAMVSRTATPTMAAAAADAAEPKPAKICVYCGSSTGKNPIYMEAARELARVMAANDIGLGESLCTSAGDVDANHC